MSVSVDTCRMSFPPAQLGVGLLSSPGAVVSAPCTGRAPGLTPSLVRGGVPLILAALWA